MSKERLNNLADNLIATGSCAFAASLCLSVSIAEIGLGICAAGLALKVYADSFAGQKYTDVICKSRMILPWLVYLAAGIIAALFGLDISRSFKAFSSDLMKAGAFFIILCAVNRIKLKNLMRWYLAGIILSALWGIGQVVYIYLIHGVFTEQWRARASISAVTYGEIMAISLAYVVAVLSVQKEKREIFIYSIPALVISAALIMSQTRGAYLGFLTFLVFLFLSYRPARVRVAVLAVLALAGVGVFSVNNPGFAVKLQTLAGNFTSIDTGAMARIKKWKVGLKILRDHPVTGVGPANVRLVFDSYHPEQIDGKTGWGNIHNLYIHQAAERGMLGFGALIFLLISMFKLALKNIRAHTDQYSLWAFSMIPGFYVMNITETSFQHALAAYSAFLMLACSVRVED